MRKALIIGIDDYQFAPLSGCVSDAFKVEEILKTNEDGSLNFECVTRFSTKDKITTKSLRKDITKLFADKAHTALFYFSGHGTVNNLGGFLVTTDAEEYQEGLPMADILNLANSAPIEEVIILLDCCHSGALGNLPEIKNDTAVLREGITIITASRATQNSLEKDGSGMFTSLLCSALDGGAADVCGNVSMAAVYTYIDQACGAWDQRPLFKSHVSKMHNIRKCEPQIEPKVLRLLPRYFAASDYEFPLDPSFEPTSDSANEENNIIFKHLQQYRAERLLIPIGTPHMYYAAMDSKSCKLTPLGQYYWDLVNKGKI